MGYEVLGAGRDAVRAGGDRAPEADRVLDLDEAIPPQPPDGHGRPQRRGVAAAALTVLALGAVAVHASGDSAPRPSQLTGPAPTATSPGTLPADDGAAAGLPLSTSTDLSTAISVGRATVPGQSVSRQIAALQGALGKRAVNASYVFEPDRRADGGSEQVGVRVVFNRRLSNDAWFSARDALNEVDPTTSRLDTVTGTTVDISMPVRPGAGCLPTVDAESSAGQLVLGETELDQVSALLPMFGLRADGGRAVITYVGAFRSRAALTRVGAALARSCGGSAAQVTYTRGPLYS